MKKLLLLFLLSSSVFAQVPSNFLFLLTTNSVTGSSTNSSLALDFRVRSRADLGLMFLTTSTTNSSTSNVIANFQYSMNGTNFVTFTSKTNALSTTNLVANYFIVPSSSIGPAATIRLDSIINRGTNLVRYSLWYAWPY